MVKEISCCYGLYPVFVLTVLWSERRKKSQSSSVLVWGNNILTAQRKWFFSLQYYIFDSSWKNLHQAIFKENGEHTSNSQLTFKWFTFIIDFGYWIINLDWRNYNKTQSVLFIRLLQSWTSIKTTVHERQYNFG